MTRIALDLPNGIALWLKGYAAAQKISVSRTVAVLCLEQRARFAQRSQERQAQFTKKNSSLPPVNAG